jgi:hypothetical protein
MLSGVVTTPAIRLGKLVAEDQREQQAAAVTQPTGAIEPPERDQRRGADQQGTEPRTEQRAGIEPGAEPEQRHTGRMVEVAPGELAGPIVVVGLVAGQRQAIGDQ